MKFLATRSKIFGMERAAEYRANAEHCRRMSALAADRKMRDQYLELSLQWDDLAATAERLLTQSRALGEREAG